MTPLVGRDKIRYGIVGMGFMGKGHAKAVIDDRNPDFCLGAVADVFEAPAKAAGAEFSVPHFTRPEKMFQSGLIDAVLIATPHYWHPVQTVQAARAGLHVLCEKPLAVTVGPARGMIAEAARCGVALGSMLQMRTRGIFKKMKELVASGQLGEIYRVSMICSNWYRTQAYYDSGAWRGTWDGEGGGILLNQAPHHLDIFQWIAALPAAITAVLETRLHKIEVENTANIICEYGGGKVGYIYATTAEYPGMEQLMVVGDRGTLIAEGGKLRWARLNKPFSEDIMANPETRADFIKGPDVQWEDVALEPDGPNLRINVIRAFAAHLLRGEPMVATAAEGINELEMSNAMYLSGHGRKTVRLPVSAEAIDRLIAKLERERSTGKGQRQRQKSLRAFRRLFK